MQQSQPFRKEVAEVRRTLRNKTGNRICHHAALRCSLAICAGLMGAGSMIIAAPAVVGNDSIYTFIADEHGMVLKTPDGRTVFRYMTKKPADSNLTANSVCCLYPVLTPKGVRAVDFAPGDHRHHRGIFLAWHAMTCGDQRADFWGWGEWAPTEQRVIVNRSFKLAEANADSATVEVFNDWMIGQQTAIEESTKISVRENEGVFVIDEDFQLTAQMDWKLDKTAFGGFCVKGRKEGESAYFAPDGKMSLPDPHHLKPETDWPAEAWYDYVIRLESGETVGVAVINHPDNPPSTWHNLKPIAMVNPCIVSGGPVSIPQGKTLRLKYRIVVHDGPPPVSTLTELTKQWCRP